VFANTEDNSNGVTNVYMDAAIDANTMAQGSYPTGSVLKYVGKTLKINPLWTPTNKSSTLKKKFAMIHEMGHNLGFFHTDIGDPLYAESITNVSTTCKNNADANSIMRNVVLEWSSFTTCDKEAFYSVYKK
jgi:hypothetical protein